MSSTRLLFVQHCNIISFFSRYSCEKKLIYGSTYWNDTHFFFSVGQLFSFRLRKKMKKDLNDIQPRNRCSQTRYVLFSFMYSLQVDVFSRVKLFQQSSWFIQKVCHMSISRNFTTERIRCYHIVPMIHKCDTF